MQTCGSQRNLKAKTSKEMKTKPMFKSKSRQLRILAVKDPKQSSWLVNSRVDMHVCNNKRLVIIIMENPTKVEESTLDAISPSRGKVKIRLALRDRIEELVLTQTNIFYCPNSPSNFVKQDLLNNTSIYHHNKDKTLYNP